jgi:hypothetical protein
VMVTALFIEPSSDVGMRSLRSQVYRSAGRTTRPGLISRGHGL